MSQGTRKGVTTFPACTPVTQAIRLVRVFLPMEGTSQYMPELVAKYGQEDVSVIHLNHLNPVTTLTPDAGATA